VALGAARLCVSHVALLPPRAGCAALHALALHPAGGVLASIDSEAVVRIWRTCSGSSGSGSSAAPSPWPRCSSRF
jgi:hypothetical protein